MFYVGQKVVCVDAKSPPMSNYNHSRNLLVDGAIYTIAWAGAAPFGNAMVQLVELPTKNQFDNQIYYQAKRFRPLVERKTDIGVLTAILNPGKVDA